MIQRTVGTRHTSSEVEAIAVPAKGEYLYRSIATLEWSEGDRIILISSDRCTFLATVEDITADEYGYPAALLQIS